jgi:uncharacterized Rmd1/YagE family protein
MSVAMPDEQPLPPTPNETGSPTLVARALVLGERIDTARLEKRDVTSSSPLAFRVDQGLVVALRYGVVVMIGLAPSAKDRVLQSILPQVVGALPDREEETIRLAAGGYRTRASTPMAW